MPNDTMNSLTASKSILPLRKDAISIVPRIIRISNKSILSSSSLIEIILEYYYLSLVGLNLFLKRFKNALSQKLNMATKKKSEKEIKQSNKDNKENDNDKKAKTKSKSKELKEESSEEDRESKKDQVASLRERAKELEKNLEKSEGKEIKVEDFKLKDTGVSKEKQKELLVPLEDYVKAGIHLGTKVISGDMRQFVYRRRADGLAILNTNIIDNRLREAIKIIQEYKPKGIMAVCKREAGWKAVKKFSEAIGAKAFGKKYPAGIITNSNLEDFYEPELVIISDPWLDKNALNDADNIKVPIIGLCDTNNILKGINYIIPCNNKSNKSLGLIFYILAKHYCGKAGIDFNAELKDFVGEEI